MTNPYPIPRAVRQTEVLLGSGGKVYGPFEGLQCFDVEDIKVYTRAIGQETFSRTDVTVSKVSGLSFDFFTIEFAAELPATTEYVVSSERVAERTAGVTSGTRLDMTALEKELSKQATVLQEIRRDIGTTLRTDFGHDTQVLPAPEEGKVLTWLNGRLQNAVVLATAGVIVGAVGQAVLAAGAPETVRQAVFVNQYGVNVAEFGASPAKTSAENEFAFNAAEAAAAGRPIYVPAGAYQLQTPMNRGYNARYYGEGMLRFDNAEWWRRGASSGSLSVNERFTLTYGFANQSDVTVTYDGILTPILSWENWRTIEVAGSASTSVNVKINIANGTLRLTSTPYYVRSQNSIDGPASALAPSLPNPTTTPAGYCNWVIGTGGDVSLISGINNTFGGMRSGWSMQVGSNNTLYGFQTGYRATGSALTLVGSITGEWITTGYNIDAFGLSAAGKIKDGHHCSVFGSEALASAFSPIYVAAFGHRALGNTGDFKPSPNYSVAFGPFAGDFAYGTNNAFGGYGSGRGPNIVGSAGGSDGVENAWWGYQSGRWQAGADYNAGIGAIVHFNITTGQGNVGAGWGAGYGLTTQVGTVLAGYKAGYAGPGNGAVIVGNEAGVAATGASLVVIGENAGINLTSAAQVTIVGSLAGRFDFGGVAITNFTNFMALGYNARVSASNQNQIGDSATLTYVYGTVQNRSDARDKADVRDTVLGLRFVLGLRPVDYRLDYRDDYVVANDNGGMTHLARDGSKKRVRFHHGFLAQDIEQMIANGEIDDFGGYQDHTVNGGGDVKTIGYDEFFAPVVRAIQESHSLIVDLRADVDELKDRVGSLEEWRQAA